MGPCSWDFSCVLLDREIQYVLQSSMTTTNATVTIAFVAVVSPLPFIVAANISISEFLCSPGHLCLVFLAGPHLAIVHPTLDVPLLRVISFLIAFLLI